MNLDKLEEEVSKLKMLLADRQTGLMSWNLCLYERLQAVANLLAAGGIKPEVDSDDVGPATNIG